MSKADQEVAIEVEELEQVIAPGVKLDHKEMMVSDSL